MSRSKGLWYRIYWITPGRTLLLQKVFHPNVLWHPRKRGDYPSLTALL